MTSSVDLVIHLGVMFYLTRGVINYFQHPSDELIPSAFAFIAGCLDAVFAVMSIPLFYSVIRFEDWSIHDNHSTREKL